MSGGAALIWVALISGGFGVLSLLVTWVLSRGSTTTTVVDAATAARVAFEKLDARREAERERERAEDKDEILRSRTEVERLRTEVAERDRRIYQLLGGGSA